MFTPAVNVLITKEPSTESSLTTVAPVKPTASSPTLVECNTPINLVPNLDAADEPEANIAKGATCWYPPTPPTLTTVTCPASLK